MQLKKFNDIAHLLPQECWAMRRNDINKGEMNDVNVLHISEDYNINNLNLDEPLRSFDGSIKKDKADSILLIFIEGNLTAKNIYNEETGGSTGLVVQGNLIADNVVVGGQEIYVTGNLTVNECFWGEYNHGDLNVLGNTTAKVFMATGEYHYEYERTRIKAEHFLLSDHEDEEYEYSARTIESIFATGLLNEYGGDTDSWDDWLDRYKVVEYLAEGEPILLPTINLQNKEQLLEEEIKNVPKVFADAAFTNENDFQQQEKNFNKLLSLIDDEEPEISFIIENTGDTVFISKEHNRSSDGKKVDAQVMILTKSGAEIYIWKKQLNPLKALISKHPPMIAHYKDISNNIISPKNVFDNKELVALTQRIWQSIIASAERGLYYQQQLAEVVKPADVISLLNLPVVQEKYNDYDDSEFWQHNYVYMVRRHGPDDYVGSLDIGVEIPSNTFDCRKYHFRPNTVENPTNVELYYCSSQGGNTTDRYNHNTSLSKVLVFDWQLYREALNWYPKIAPAIELENKWFLANIAEEKEAEEKRKQQLAEKKTKPQTVPFETMVFNSITFKVITIHEAHALIGSLTNFQGEKIYDVHEDTWRFPDYEDNAIFLLAEEDVEVEKFEMEYSTDEQPDVFILAFIFKKNLTVTSFISAYDTDNSPALIVLGKTTATNITLFGNVHYIGNGMACDSFVGFYNHGELFVKGDTNAWLIYTDDMHLHFERFAGIGAVISQVYPQIYLNSKLQAEDGTFINVENRVPNTHYLSDIVNDTFVETNDDREELGGDYYTRAFEANLSLIDHDKKPRFGYENFAQDFRQMIKELSDLKKVKESGSIYLSTDYTQFAFLNFEFENNTYQELSNKYTGALHICLRTLLNIDTNEMLLLFEYLDENGDAMYQWQDNENNNSFEFLCVKHAMYDAYKALKEEELANKKL